MPEKRKAAPTARYERRRTAIVDAASAAINVHGMRGLSINELAGRLGLNGTSITYYYKRKEQLAQACFDRSLDLLEEQIDVALTQDDPRARIRRFVAANFSSLPRLLGIGDGPQTVRLTDLRALDDPARAPIVRRYFALFRKARAIFGYEGKADSPLRLLRLMQTHILLEAVHAMQMWIDRYSPEEFDRVEKRFVELLLSGVAAQAPTTIFEGYAPPVQDIDDDRHARFLDVATRLINLHGYRGASVDRIAAQLNVTKGSFYHHHDAKDDLVLDCYLQSLDQIDAAQLAGFRTPSDPLVQLSGTMASLVAIQFSNGTPLVRSTAMEALPPELRAGVVERSDHIARRFAGMVADGITVGSIRPVDPLVCGQFLMSSLNVAFELRTAIPDDSVGPCVRQYCRLVLDGLLADGRA